LKEYFVHSEGQQLGPFSPATIDKMLKDGSLSSDSQVWTEGMESWQPADVIYSDITPKIQPPQVSREHVYFERGGVRVTNSRFLPGDQTFALSAINSVKLVTVRADQKPVTFLVLLAVLLAVAGMASQSMGWFLAALLFGLVAFLVYQGRKIRMQWL